MLLNVKLEKMTIAMYWLDDVVDCFLIKFPKVYLNRTRKEACKKFHSHIRTKKVVLQAISTLTTPDDVWFYLHV